MKCRTDLVQHVTLWLCQNSDWKWPFIAEFTHQESWFSWFSIAMWQFTRGYDTDQTVPHFNDQSPVWDVATHQPISSGRSQHGAMKLTVVLQLLATFLLAFLAGYVPRQFMTIRQWNHNLSRNRRSNLVTHIFLFFCLYDSWVWVIWVIDFRQMS